MTFTNPGTNRDTNTGIWYTTDGSTPVPGSGTAQYIASGGTIAVSTTTTVKAVGMWGAQNQPTSYPSGYGYAPSAVISATYTAGGGSVTLNSVTLSAAGSVTSITTGASVQMNAACHYNNGTTTSCNTTDAYGNSVSSWNTSNAAIVTISGSGLASGVAVGSANLTATAAGVTSAPFALAVTAPSVTLSSVTLATTGGVTSIVAGSTNQLIATCHYSDGSTTTCTTTDSHGNAVCYLEQFGNHHSYSEPGRPGDGRGRGFDQPERGGSRDYIQSPADAQRYGRAPHADGWVPGHAGQR